MPTIRTPVKLAAGVTATAALVVLALSGSSSGAAADPVDVFPIPGGHVAAPTTQITFRGVGANQLGPVSVTGSSSGPHTGGVIADSDGDGASFLPSVPFKAGETVTVTTGLSILGASHGSFSFTVATPAGRVRGAAPRPIKRVRGDVWRFASRHDLVPAAVRVTKQPSHAAAGDLFVASQIGPLQNGPELLGPRGGLIYFKPVPRGDSTTDFRAQTYNRRPVLTWWQGAVSAAGVGRGEDEIYDASYRPVATVKAGNGLVADLHEFEITPANTALVTAYYPVRWNISAVKGKTRQAIVLDSVVQEIDIPTGLVLYQWDSLDHVAVSDSHQPRPKDPGHPWDYFHINSAQPQGDGTLILSARDTWAVYKVAHTDGAIEWTLGGRHSSFRMGKNTIFAFQHDARIRANSEITIFDDGAGPPLVHKQSRGMTLRLDTRHKVATLLRQLQHRPPLLAAYEGNMQRQSNGDDLVGWGQQPYLTEFNSRGKEVFDARFIGNTDSYRAYRLPWRGTPVTRPAAAVSPKHHRRTVYASWNGDDRVSRWRVLAGASTRALKPVASHVKTSFETGVRVAHAYRFVAVQALDARGHVLGTSAAIKG